MREGGCKACKQGMSQWCRSRVVNQGCIDSVGLDRLSQMRDSSHFMVHMLSIQRLVTLVFLLCLLVLGVAKGERLYAASEKDFSARCPSGTVGIYDQPSGERRFIECQAHDERGKVSRSVSFHDNGQVVRDYRFIDGSPDGLAQEWYQNGTKRSEAMYQKGVRHGAFRHWYREGGLACEGTYETGKPVGLWNCNDDQGKTHKTEYINGVRWNGLFVELDSSGNRQIQGILRNGMKQGIWRSWYPDGQLQSEREYRDGLDSGRAREWYETGKIQFDCVYRQVGPDGLCSKWYANGQKEAEERYAKGYPDGLWVKWFPNGMKQSQGAYAKCAEKDALLPEDERVAYEEDIENRHAFCRVGMWSEWREDGAKLHEQTY